MVSCQKRDCRIYSIGNMSIIYKHDALSAEVCETLYLRMWSSDHPRPEKKT